MHVQANGRRTFIPIAGLPGRVVPQVVLTATPGASTEPPNLPAKALTRLLRPRLPAQNTSGPAAARPSEWRQQPLPRGDYVVYTGADQVHGQFNTVCNRQPVSGSITTWLTPRFGILQCNLHRKPPADSVGALVLRYCPTGNA